MPHTGAPQLPPELLQQGVCDLGFVGRNKLEEYGCGMESAPRELRALGFGACRLSIAVPRELEYAGVQALQGLRIAISHPKQALSPQGRLRTRGRVAAIRAERARMFEALSGLPEVRAP